MKPGAFRFDALIGVYQTQEDSLVGEIASLERERKGLQTRVEEFLQECRDATETLGEGGRGEDLETVVRYVEGLRRWIEQSRVREADLSREVEGKLAALRAVRTERMRFGKLKQRHIRLVDRHTKRLEQKVTDEFAQRKRDV